MEEKIMNVAEEMAPAAVEVVSKGVSKAAAYGLGVVTGVVGTLATKTIFGKLKEHHQKKLNEAEVAQTESNEDGYTEVNRNENEQ